MQLSSSVNEKSCSKTTEEMMDAERSAAYPTHDDELIGMQEELVDQLVQQQCYS